MPITIGHERLTDIVTAMMQGAKSAPDEARTIAENLVKEKLAELGLGGSDLSITQLTPWRVEVRNLTTGPKGTARIDRLAADLSWPTWTRPAVSGLSLDGVQLNLAITDGALDAGDLAPLLAMGGSGASDPSTAPAVPEIMVNDAFVEIIHPGGPTVVSLTGVEVGLGADGAVDLRHGEADIVHPSGQATVLASGIRRADGEVTLNLTLDGGLLGALVDVGAVVLLLGVGQRHVARQQLRQ